MILKFSALFVLLWLAAGLPAGAQSGARLSGLVLSPQGSPAAGAVVEVVGNGLRLEHRSDSHGRFAFDSLPIGTYGVHVTAASGTAYCSLDLPSEGAAVTLQLLKTVGSTRSTSSPAIHGSGTDVVLNQDAILHSPAYASLPNLLLQLPGAARGANGVVHINGDHGDINYVVDGVAIPQALNREVGTEIDPSDIAFMDVLEGAYPAQYGGRFAAVVNIDTKTSRGRAGVNGYVAAGSFAAFDSNVEYHSPIGKGSIEIASRQERSGRALDPPAFDAVHDNGSDANQFIRYALPLGNDFLVASAMHSLQTFQTPNDVAGGAPASTDDNDTQDDTFLNLQYHRALRANGALVYGIAFKRSHIRDFNDPLNDFAYGEALNISSGGAPSDCASGVVSACAYSLFSDRTATDAILSLDASSANARHAIKYGLTYDATNVQKLYAVTLQPNNFISSSPATVVDNAPNIAHSQSAYAQDSWTMGRFWRTDYGVRADAFQLFSTQFTRGFFQFSPRLKIARVYGSRADIYFYAGRFFTPFSYENVSPAAAQRLNAPLQPSIAQFDLKPQRDTDIEIGGSMPLGPGQLGLRVMQKLAFDVIDDTQVGVTALHQDINYARGSISSQSAYYQQALPLGGRAYLSLTHTRSVNKGCETELLAPCFGASNDWTPADHDQRWDGAGGASLSDGRRGWWSIDAEYGSGLSSAYCKPATDECKVPPHTTFDMERGVALSHDLTLTVGIYNMLNDRYRITYLNAQGNHYAEGRAFRLGLRFGASHEKDEKAP
jgi:hypothetical protein